MRAVIQRVSHASVSIEGREPAAIGQGLLVLLGCANDDNDEDITWLVKKITGLRIFDDDTGVMNRSVMDVDGEILAVSQFTLNASTKKGNRPSYIHAAGHELAVPLYDGFCNELQNITGKTVQKGVFGADMKVELINDGPVTIIVDSKLKE